jgi:hypothetical protein
MLLFYGVQGNKNIKIILKSGLGVLLLLYMGYSLFRQIQHQPHLHESMQQLLDTHSLTRWGYLLAVVVLMFFNWLCEAEKWRRLMQSTAAMSRWNALQAVLTGVSVSMLTPNRIGEYAGRVLYLSNKHKLKGITVTLVGSLAQVLVSALMGSIGLLIYILHQKNYTAWMLLYLILSLLIGLGLLILYFNLNWISSFCARYSYLRKIKIYVDVIQRFPKRLLMSVLCLSLVRFLIYSLQLVFLFYFVLLDAPFYELLGMVWAIFWTLAVVPTIALAELGVRGQTALFFMGALTTNALGVVSAMVLLWFINLIIPALTGCLFVFRMKLYDDE